MPYCVEIRRDHARFLDSCGTYFFSTFTNFSRCRKSFVEIVEFAEENVDVIVCHRRDSCFSKLNKLVRYEPRTLKDICFANIKPLELPSYFLKCHRYQPFACKRHLVFRYILPLKRDDEMLYDVLKHFMERFYENATWQLFETKRHLCLYCSERVYFDRPDCSTYNDIPFVVVASDRYPDILNEPHDKHWYNDTFSHTCNEDFVRFTSCSNDEDKVFDMLCKQMCNYLKCSYKNSYGAFFDVYKRLIVYFELNGLQIDLA